MEIIALAYKTKSKSIFEKSVLYAFIKPAWAGNDIVEAELHISINDLNDYDESLILDSYKDAHKKAYLSEFPEEFYNRDYPTIH